MITEQDLHEYNKWLMEVWNPNQLYIPFAIDAPKAFLDHRSKVEKLSKADVSGSFLSDLNFIIDNMGYDLVKDKVSKEAQQEYLKRLKMMRNELRQNCH